MEDRLLKSYLSLHESVNLLNPCCNTFLCISETKGRLPLLASFYLNSPIFFVFSLKLLD